MSNTLTRTLSGSVFLVIMTGGLLAGPSVYAFIMLFAVLVMTSEYLKISKINKKKYISSLTLFASALMFSTVYFIHRYNLSLDILLLNAILFCILLAAPLYIKKSDDRQEGSTLVGAILYTTLPFTMTSFVVFGADGAYYPNLLLSMFFILWSSDVGAYIAGVTFGQKSGHKLFPSISPKKSWEGFAGGLIAAVVTGVIIHYTDFVTIPLIHIIAISLIINIGGVFGDLTESLFKRRYNVKDSGSIMPGHGGLLDRFDGALIAFPAAITYILLFNLF